MMVFDRFVIALGAVVDDANDVVENITRRLPRYLPARLMQGRAEVVRCRATTKTGVQCKRRLVPGSNYCFQHRQDSGLLIVIEAPDKAARKTSDLPQETWAAMVRGASRLAAWSPKLRAQVLSGERISGVRQVARRMVESLQDGANDVVANIARRLPWHLPTRLMEGQAEVVPCRGTVQSGAQCKDRPVPGSAYCFQHRNQAKSDGRLFIVLEARDKATKMTSDLSRKTWTATVGATTRLAAWSPKLRAQVLSGERILGLRRIAGGAVKLLQVRRKWVSSAMVLLFVAAIPIAFLTAAGGDLDSLARFAAEIISRNPPAREGNPNTFGRQETPTDNPNAAGGFTLDGTRAPGSDFTGAYVVGVEHLSADSSLLQIFVPAGVEGTYRAVVNASEGVEYQCVILPQFKDRLYCIGPSLPGTSQINIQIFRIDEVDGSESLVFETNYTTGEFAPLATPSPNFGPYGIGFVWPDRFNEAEVEREYASSSVLAPASALATMLVVGVWLLPRFP